ncbi:hypothetical protein GCM10027275_13410 [Rhabdobacter roseus]|uniref:SGNH/GDSL hydrolase family protein n=1 Tax=Rhabdobacter roseus TaxID=1655419 RepID=A0A840TNC0_9BACT|nr:hypothetical protein [Rhabdobacter roseus]MBB5283257.1 hypothetical protein [Rhabdobacter roseus]
MIKKVIILFLLLFGLYELLLHLNPKWSISQNQNQDNFVKAERYLFEEHQAQSITIVGTSLSARLVMDSLPSCYNLSFGGMGLQDGLQIINHSLHRPKVLLLETNFYFKNGSTDFLESVLNPVNLLLKKYIQAFRSEKQPIALLTDKIKRVIKGYKVNTSNFTERTLVNHAPFQERVFQDFIKEYSFPPDTAIIETHLLQLKQELTLLQKEGTRIIFFEMPVNPTLQQSVRCRFVSKKIKEYFSPTHYVYLPKKDWQFETTDGIHLKADEAAAFTSFLKDYLAKHNL